MGKARSNPNLQATAGKTAPVINAGTGTAKGRRTAAGVGVAIVAGAGAATRTGTAIAVGTKKRKTSWDQPVGQVLKEHFPNNSATDFKARVVVKKVWEVLKDEIKKSRTKPSRGLILRKSGHWKKR
jgi:hypothetical protein